MLLKNDAKLSKLIKRLPLLSKFGLALVVTSVILLCITFAPVIWQELSYNFKKVVIRSVSDATTESTAATQLIPVDLSYSIVVPKIGANARIVDNVDPFNEPQYQVALTKGVAHAINTANPGEIGNVFLFAHSTDNFINANRYNAVFYLIHKLDIGDKFEIYFKGKKYEYTTTEKSIVEATAVTYLEQPKNDRIATLVTCWPPGTTLKRLIVVGKQL